MNRLKFLFNSLSLKTQNDYIKELKLDLPIENGYLTGTYPCKKKIPEKYLPTNSDATLFSFAYYLLPSKCFNPLHKINLYESWQYCDGAPINLYTISPQGKLEKTIVGPGGTFVHIVPPGYWMCAHINSPYGPDFTLVSHFGMPSFNPQEHVKGERGKLLKEFPQHSNLINTFSWGKDVIHHEL